ncbi:phosphoenolpyruvate mutase [Sorangium sp. So ce1128]
MRKTEIFRRLLLSTDLTFAMEAHDGLSARIVEEAGFPIMWASGLSISTALGVRDSNEASWSQVMDVLEFMADATSIPIFVDGDSGHGNFNTVRRFVKQLNRRNIAAVCLEDKLFPKMNSLLGERQPLADPAEFCGRIKAAKDSQTDDAFCVVARVEALISGHGMPEALRRADAYQDAGADAILIHSKKDVADEVLTFADRWSGRCPLIIIPTRYYHTPVQRFRDARVALVIWANHNMRAAAAAMLRVSRRIQAEESVTGVDGEIAPLDTIFSMFDYDELFDAERRYLPGR